jgi:4-amino-4-deoxy-L-arabinose transferase-like glycosyltransferase
MHATILRIAQPAVVGAVALFLLAAFHAFLLPVGSLHHGDEFLTLDRSNSFLLRDDWLTVFSNNQPTFKKPPLQYWMTAGLLQAGVGLESAVRLPSFLFGLGILVNTALLARLILPVNRWAAPVAIILMSSSTRFWESSLSGLLDNGATFFATLAMIAAFRALERPRWWYVVAVTCGLGALQKAPLAVAFAAAPIIGQLLAPTRGAVLRASLCSRHFVLAVVLTTALILAWPLLQWLRHGGAAVHEAFVQQFLERFSPAGEESGGPRRSVYTLLLNGEPFLRIPGIAAMILLPWLTGRRDLWILPIILGVYAIVVAMASGFVSPRYSLYFLPQIMACFAAVIVIVFPRPLHRAIAIALISAASLGPFKTVRMLDLDNEGIERFVPIMRSVGNAVRPGEALIICGRDAGAERLYSGALSYYATGGQPYFRLRKVEALLAHVTEGALSPPFRGLCSQRQFEALSTVLSEIHAVKTDQGFVHWTATGLQHAE